MGQGNPPADLVTTAADLEQLGYTVDIAPDGATAAVRGYGVATMVHRDDAGAVFATLADPDGHAERRFQYLHPAAHKARARLAQAGYTVERVDPSADTFTITSPHGKPPAQPSPATPDQLVTIADEVTP